ncbi:metabolite traffic protein EboE [Fulvivirgaceae bacterium BMA12]|uniref:Metabolite traffic protein EboE n=1 Tax=Agaribacillus aureus TaxID=3051825 RepID=A0ABT8L967_9BACT|nr:metabolite traffic protein EboE [Fulvivirgaceae bacterium BMA12]
MQLKNNQHLTYCTNIHKGESWSEVFTYLKQYIPEIKSQVSPDSPFGIGIRLSDLASKQLLEGQALDHFKSWLTENELYVFTMNGFPFGSFHGERVKDQVHHPDWTTRERVDYTVRLFKILAEILPEGVDGGISTSPISYKLWWNHDNQALNEIWEKGTRHLLEVIKYLIELEKETGKKLHLDIEPEPDGLLENTAEVLTYFQKWLIPMGTPFLKEHFGFEAEEAERRIKSHLQICYDVCHFAVVYEEPDQVFQAFRSAGIGIGKIQISAALKALFTSDAGKTAHILEDFHHFNEPTYLHQVVGRDASDVKYQYNDLPAAIEHFPDRDFREWRSHFHVPVFLDKYDQLESTQEDILKVFALNKVHEITQHLEVETYTWEVLPQAMQVDLTTSITRELNWVLKNVQ